MTRETCLELLDNLTKAAEALADQGGDTRKVAETIEDATGALTKAFEQVEVWDAMSCAGLQLPYCSAEVSPQPETPARWKLWWNAAGLLVNTGVDIHQMSHEEGIVIVDGFVDVRRKAEDAGILESEGGSDE